MPTSAATAAAIGAASPVSNTGRNPSARNAAMPSRLVGFTESAKAMRPITRRFTTTSTTVAARIAPGTTPGTAPDTAPGTAPDTAPGTAPDAAPDAAAGTAPDPGSVAKPGPARRTVTALVVPSPRSTTPWAPTPGSFTN